MASGETKLRLYNTLTREKADFVPLDPANVRMYVCGPTVYDFAHIGNARPVIVFDVLFRLLRHLAAQGVWDGGKGATEVTYVRNITDVDDKINARALRDFGEEIAAGSISLNEAIRRVTEKTNAQFQADVKALGCLEPTVQPRATEHIAGMVVMIQKLIDNGCAYVAKGREGREVLFDVLAMPDYGGLSKRNLEEQQAGARIAVEAHKKNPADFILWKESFATEPDWDATFEISEENQRQLGLNARSITIRGRPGWHIECSVMSEAHLGETFDIHGGGLDLIFPHHENELAQSRCAHGTPMMAQVWMHNGFLQVEGQKMSKSLGNFVTIHELLNTEKFGGRKWPGEVLRLAMLMTHYREPIDFSIARLEEALKLWTKWSRWIDYYPDAEPVVPKAIIHRLCEDLNTRGIVRDLSEISALASGVYHGAEPPQLEAHENQQRENAGLLRGALEFLGVSVAGGRAERDDQVTRQMIAERLAALNAKDFATADRIRADLLEHGIQLMDSKNATGERVTTWEVKR